VKIIFSVSIISSQNDTRSDYELYSLNNFVFSITLFEIVTSSSGFGDLTNMNPTIETNMNTPIIKKNSGPLVFWMMKPPIAFPMI